MRVFFDSSAFVKRYVSEEGTDVMQLEAAAKEVAGDLIEYIAKH